MRKIKNNQRVDFSQNEKISKGLVWRGLLLLSLPRKSLSLFTVTAINREKETHNKTPNALFAGPSFSASSPAQAPPLVPSPLHLHDSARLTVCLCFLQPISLFLFTLIFFFSSSKSKERNGRKRNTSVDPC